MAQYNCSSISCEVFKEAILFSFAFQVCYICIKNRPLPPSPRSYFIAKFWSIWRRLRDQFYLARKNCERIFGVKNFSWQEMFLVISRCRKSLVMSAPKPDNSYNYFGCLLVCLYDLNIFYMSQEFR